MIRIPTALFAIMLGCWSVLAHATSVVQLSLPQLVQQSDVVVLGQPISATSYWQRGRIFTRTTFAIDETWAGTIARTARTSTSTGDHIAIVTLGGVVGGIGQKVMGIATLPTDQRAVICLKQNADHTTYAVVGMAMGVFYVDDAAPLADPPVYQTLEELHRVPHPGRSSETSAALITTPSSLATLRQAVMEAAHGR